MASQFRPTYFSVYLENPHHLCLLLTWWQPTYVLGLYFFWTNKTLLYIFMPFFSYLLFWFKSRLLKRAANTSHISAIAEFDKSFLSLQNLHLRVTLKNLNVENANIKVSVFPVDFPFMVNYPFNKFQPFWKWMIWYIRWAWRHWWCASSERKQKWRQGTKRDQDFCFSFDIL